MKAFGFVVTVFAHPCALLYCMGEPEPEPSLVAIAVEFEGGEMTDQLESLVGGKGPSEIRSNPALLGYWVSGREVHLLLDTKPGRELVKEWGYVHAKLFSLLVERRIAEGRGMKFPGLCTDFTLGSLDEVDDLVSKKTVVARVSFSDSKLDLEAVVARIRDKGLDDRLLCFGEFSSYDLIYHGRGRPEFLLFIEEKKGDNELSDVLGAILGGDNADWESLTLSRFVLIRQPDSRDAE